jgi:two-component system response regulator MprA
MTESRTSAPPARRSDARRILVVDDDATVCAALEGVLTLEGHTVSTVNSALAVLAEVGRFAPHVVVLDVHMPEKPGDALSKELRAAHPELAIILHTGSALHSCDGQYADLVVEKGTVFTFLAALRRFLARPDGAGRG